MYPLVGQACNEDAGIKIPELRNGRDHPVDVFNLGDEGRAFGEEDNEEEDNEDEEAVLLLGSRSKKECS